MKKQASIAVALAIAGVLVACKDSADNEMQRADKFTQAVQDVVATSSDTALPELIDSVMVVDADTAAPIAVY